MGLSLNRWHCLYSLGTTKHSRKTEPVLVILMTSSDMVPGMVNMNIKTERNTILNLRKRNKNVYEGTARYCASNERKKPARTNFSFHSGSLAGIVARFEDEKHGGKQ